jgi:hypothetical protein
MDFMRARATAGTDTSFLRAPENLEIGEILGACRCCLVDSTERDYALRVIPLPLCGIGMT